MYYNYFFQILAAQSNKYTRREIAARNSKLYIGHKLTNIAVGKIIILFVAILRVLIDPWKMEGYPPYFLEYPMIHLGCGYSIQIRFYDTWGKYVIHLIILK